MASKQEDRARRDFAERYAAGRNEAVRDLERAVIGCDHGANGYTTSTQARDMADLLDLGKGDLLLDVGSGRGWPGLFISQLSGCRVVLSDLTLDGLREASARASDDGTALEGAVVVSAKHPPFRPRSFHGIVHSDVFC